MLARVGRALHGGVDTGDEPLVARVGAGDDRAFEEIVDRYGAGLLSFCVHMLGSRDWGEDALQLTLTSAYQALSRGRRPDALRPWLYTIARNRCLSELRSRHESAGSDAIVVERAELDGPPSLVARREQLRELVEDIQRLPDDQRAALVLFELGDYSHAEIASVLNVRCDKVKALIFQAREGLMRGRTARESPCSEVRERMASARGTVPARGLVRAHIDRCASCRAYEHEARRQRSALALGHHAGRAQRQAQGVCALSCSRKHWCCGRRGRGHRRRRGRRRRYRHRWCRRGIRRRFGLGDRRGGSIRSGRSGCGGRDGRERWRRFRGGGRRGSGGGLGRGRRWRECAGRVRLGAGR